MRRIARRRRRLGSKSKTRKLRQQTVLLMERSDAPRVGQRPWGNHHDRYYSGDERGGGAFHTASKVLNSSNMATSDCRHRSKRDDRLDVSTGLWICQTSLSADLIDPAPGQMVSLAKSAKRPQGSTAIKLVGFPVRRTTCPAPFWPRRALCVSDHLNDHVLAPRTFERAPVVIRDVGFRLN
jgi:hypothetical protein